MAVTGRFFALAALGLLVAAWSALGLILFSAVLIVLVAVDLAFAARITGLRLFRDPTAAVRLGETGRTVLHLTNLGRRRMHGLVRDAWVPSAGLAPRVQRIAVGPGSLGRFVWRV